MACAKVLLAAGKITHEVRYGGDWSQNQRVSDEKFVDAGHFELV